MVTKKRTFVLLALALVLILISGIGASASETAGYSVKKHTKYLNLSEMAMDIKLNNEITGRDIQATFDSDSSYYSFYMMVPKNATSDSPAPCIITSHGYLNNKDMQDINYVEWSRRGYVVLSVDMSGHGESDFGVSTKTAGYGMEAAVEWAASQPFVNPEKIGVSGHSMGGGAISSTLKKLYELELNYIAGALYSASSPIAMPGFYQEGITVGTIAPMYDEFFYRQEGKYAQANSKTTIGNEKKYEFLPKDYRFSPDGIMFIQQTDSGFSGDEVVEGTFYTSDGVAERVDGKAVGSDARVIYSPAQIHPWAHFSLTSAGHGSDFWYGVFGTPEGANYVKPSNQLWWLKETFNLIGLIGFFMLCVPLVELLLATSLFASLRKKENAFADTPELKGAVSHSTFWFGGIVTTLLAGFTIRYFYSSTYGMGNKLFPVSLLYPQTTTNSIVVWALGTGIIALVIFIAMHFVKTLLNRKNSDYVASNPFNVAKISGSNFLKTFMLMFFVVGIMYAVVFIQKGIWGTDFRLWSMAVLPFQMLKLGTIFRYFFIFLIYYTINALINANNKFRNKPEWFTVTISAIFNVLGILIIFAIQYGTMFSTGELWQPDMRLGYIVLFPIVPILIIATIWARKLYNRTGNIWLGAMVNAMIMTIIPVANTISSLGYTLF